MRHEKIILVVLAYVIGFTTAFIAFGIDPSGFDQSKTAVSDFSQQASVRSSLTPKAVEREDGLYVVLNDKDRILSAVANSSQVGREGFHNAIVTAQVSPAGEFIHYCSQVRAEDNFCLNYVYDLSTDSVHRVQTSDSDHVASLISASGDSWIGDRTLMIEGMRSVGEETPWRLQ